MIVNHTAEGWLVITQRAHGLLAGEICVHWRKDMQPAQWFDTLIATTEHDDAHNELDKGDLLDENGGPKDYKMKNHSKGNFDPEFCDGLLKRAVTKGRYIALLIARHIHFLYDDEEEAQAYCKALKKKESIWLKEADCKKEDIDKSYQLLEFCDAFSLLICEQKLPPEGRKMEISDGPDGKTYQLHINDKQQIVVSPWPFDEANFTIHYETRLLRQLVFKNNAEFLKVFNAAPVTINAVQLTKK